MKLHLGQLEEGGKCQLQIEFQPGDCPQAMGIQLAVATRCLAHAIQANLGIGEVHVEQIEATIVEAYNQEIQCPGQKPPKVMPPEPVAQSFSM